MKKNVPFQVSSIRFFAILLHAILLSVFLLNSATAQPDLRKDRSSRRQKQDSILEAQLKRIPFDGKAAYKILKDMCDLGSRMTGSKGMQKQIEFIKAHCEKLGGKVEFQKFQMRHPVSGNAVEVVNTIVQWHPERTRRVLVCCHYDTRPFPDKDPKNPGGKFVGANDGASGVGLLCELGRHMKEIKGDVGVDFVFFDAEEFIFIDQGEFFVGSTHFARQYVSQPRKHHYFAGVLVDMIGDKNLNLYQEKNSLKYAEKLTKSIWKTARKLRVTNFIHRAKHEVRDDHLPLNQIAKIPTCDIIDFDYPRPGSRNSYWHTTKDTPDKCSPVSLAKVGWVLVEWLKSLK